MKVNHFDLKQPPQMNYKQALQWKLFPNTSSARVQKMPSICPCPFYLKAQMCQNFCPFSVEAETIKLHTAHCTGFFAENSYSAKSKLSMLKANRLGVNIQRERPLMWMHPHEISADWQTILYQLAFERWRLRLTIFIWTTHKHTHTHVRI